MTSETLVTIAQTTQRNNPEDRNLHTLMTEAVRPLKRWLTSTRLHSATTQKTEIFTICIIYYQSAHTITVYEFNRWLHFL
jgi:hypothetical protein